MVSPRESGNAADAAGLGPALAERRLTAAAARADADGAAAAAAAAALPRAHPGA
eukprot:gene19010-45944_t